MGGGGLLKDGGDLGLHQIAAHLVGAVGQTAPVLIAARAQQNLRRADRPSGQHHLMAAEQPALAFNLHFDPTHLLTRWVDVKPHHPGVLLHRDRGLGAGGLDAEAFGVPGGIYGGIGPTQRQVVGMQGLPLQGRVQVLEEGLDRPWRRWIGVGTARGGWIGSGHPMDLIELFGLFVPGFEIGIAQLPVRRWPLLQVHAAEFRFPHPLQHRAPDLGVATDRMHHLGCKRIAVGSKPRLLRMEILFVKQIKVGKILIDCFQNPATLQ